MRISDWSSDVCSSDLYDTGELVRLLALAPTEARTVALADRANRLLERLQRHHRRVDSVLYDGGRYTAVVYEWTAPPAFPEVRPRYACSPHRSWQAPFLFAPIREVPNARTSVRENGGQ